MRKPMRMRPSLNDQRRSSVAAQRFLALSAPPEKRESAMKQVEEQAASIPAKREPRAATDPNDSEGPVQNAVNDLLAVHPKVLFAVRQNSGGAQYQNAAGKFVPVQFYKMVRKPSEMTIVDNWGFLVDGRPFAFECKRPSWDHPRTDREMRQWAYINMIVKLGGVGSFVRSADEVAALIR